MAKTALADIIVPEVFEQYAIERTAQLSAFVQSGIVEQSSEFDALAAGGGLTVEMPFWKDLTADRQVLSDSASLTINKITSDKDIARIQNDGQTWGVNHLAKVTSGDDPMGAIVDLVAGYWARVDLAAVARRASRPMVWMEVFGGGIGGLIARSRPGTDPTPQDMRVAYLQFCTDNPDKSTTRSIGRYATENTDREVLVASDYHPKKARHVCCLFATCRGDRWPPAGVLSSHQA